MIAPGRILTRTRRWIWAAPGNAESQTPNDQPTVRCPNDVAITLTVQTQQKDPITGQYQLETKALLNVSPRNVYNAWQLANAGFTDHLQSTPSTISALLGM